MNDELDRLRASRPDVDPPSDRLVQSERQHLMTHITETTRDRRVDETPDDPAKRNRRLWMAPALAVGLLATAAAGWAMTRSVETSTEVSCGMTNVIDSVTGDPVADCAAWWRSTNHTDAPTLVAYDNGHGGVAVLPESEDAPADWTRLEGFQQDTTLIELDAALGDMGDGLAADCFTDAAAEPVVSDTLDRLGLGDWSVIHEGRAADGSSTCAQHVLDPEERAVVLVGLDTGRPPADAPPSKLARRVQARVDGACLGLDDAVAAVQQSAADAGVDESAGQLVIHSVVDPDAQCSRTDVNVGGGIVVTVRGR